jgi:hypothetical protein
MKLLLYVTEKNREIECNMMAYRSSLLYVSSAFVYASTTTTNSFGIVFPRKNRDLDYIELENEDGPIKFKKSSSIDLWFYIHYNSYL